MEREEEKMEKKSINLKGVPETMLQTLYARAKESKKPDHVIYDAKAIEIVEELDYDFTKADKDTAMASGVIARTIVLDQMVGEFLEKNPDAVVVNIACGLDTRCYRMAGRYKRWYNVDLFETMQVRERFLRENGPIYQIAGSAMDASYADAVKCDGEPVLAVIEGLTMYLNEQEVKQMFGILADRFAEVTVMAETMSPFVASHIKEKSIDGSQAKFSWGIKNGKELQKLLPQFENQRDVSLVEGMEQMMPVYRVIGKIPFVRNLSNKILVMKHV